MAIDSLETKAAEEIEEIRVAPEPEKDRKAEIIDSVEDLVGKVRQKMTREKGESSKSALFELLAEKQHELELVKQGEDTERSELENEILDYLKLRAAGRLRRPDAIDIRRSENDGRIEIVGVVEATTKPLDRRKYLQLMYFAEDLSETLRNSSGRDLQARGYKILPNVHDMISVSAQLATTVYMPAETDLTDINSFADRDGFSNEEWDEFVEDVLPKVQLKNSSFSSEDLRKMEKELSAFIW